MAVASSVKRKGFEQTLPMVTFLLLLFPGQAQIQLPGLFDLTVQRVIIIELLILSFFCSGPHRTQNEIWLPLKVLNVLLIAWMVLSACLSVVPVVSIKTVLSQCFDFFVPFYLYASRISRIDTVHGVLSGFVKAMILCSVFGFFESYYDWSVLSLFPPATSRLSYGSGLSDRGIRVQATFPHAILFGAALALAIPITLYLISIANKPSKRYLLWTGLFLMFLNLYKTASRGPWIATIVSLGILLLARGSSVKRYVIIIALLSAAVLIVRPGVWTSIYNLYQETGDPESEQGQSYQWRYALFDLAKNELSQDTGRALWGFGPESFFYLGLEGEFQGMHVKYDSCDSAVVELMMDTGYVGFGLVALLLLTAAVGALRSHIRLSRPVNSLSVVLFANLCAFAFLMTNVELFGWGQQSYMLWIVMALAAVCLRGTTRQLVAEPGAELLPHKGIAEYWSAPSFGGQR